MYNVILICDFNSGCGSKGRDTHPRCHCDQASLCLIGDGSDSIDRQPVIMPANLYVFYKLVRRDPLSHVFPRREVKVLTLHFSCSRLPRSVYCEKGQGRKGALIGVYLQGAATPKFLWLPISFDWISLTEYGWHLGAN